MPLVLEFFKMCSFVLGTEIPPAWYKDICYLAAERAEKGVESGVLLLFLPSRAGLSWKTRD